MINVSGFRYCRLGTANLEDTVKFATDIIGLEVVDRENGFVYVRGDDRAQPAAVALSPIRGRPHRVRVE